MTGVPTATEPTRLGVLGWPVAHSRSPAIQNAALAAVGFAPAWRYQLLPAAPELLGELLAALPAAGFRGANVTIPHKEAAVALATEMTDRAREIGAANTLIFQAGATLIADNTDGPAIAGALPFAMTGRRALVLGAGGSARAAVWALRHAGAEHVAVFNRTPERARELCDALGGEPVSVISGGADVLVNCTSVGLDGSDPFDRLPLSADDLREYRCVVDLVYAPGSTRLLAAARERGVATVDGLELLVGQGGLAFELFTGRPAPIEVMRAAAIVGGP